MRVPDFINKCVCFLCVEKPCGGYMYGGTAFLVEVASDPKSPADTHKYLVTARHCVQQARSHGPLFVRLNRSNGNAVVERIQSEWLYSDDDAVDVAVTPFVDPAPLDHLFLNNGSFVNQDRIAEFGIGIGDDIV